MKYSGYKKHIAISIIVLIAITGSCKKDPKINDDTSGTGCTIVQMTPYAWTNPPHFPEAVLPGDNTLTLERIALGKQLYYDERLSNNGESCNTCHLQNKGFSADGVSVFDKGLAKLPLENMAWYNNFMWAGRITGSLEDVMYAEITKRFSTDIAKINAIQDYRDKFCKYYGTDVITAQDLAKPLAQFMRVLVSNNTKFDRYLAGIQPLTPQELMGHSIFFTEKGDCFHCHVFVLFSDNMMHNNGIDSLYAKDIDKGYYNVTGNILDLGKFRTPNLRNVALRTSFMHDGRFTSLLDVVNFYDHQVHTGVTNIDPLMVKPAKLGGLKLTEEEKIALIAFLKTLTDDTLTTKSDFKKD
ncbi:MAG: cytochrome-c peroxidase [Bacteroidetes bacterium]|nr:cytochrome-c peroxidase [Bacteroidota bacterium]